MHRHLITMFRLASGKPKLLSGLPRSVYINNRLAFKTTSGPSLTALIEKQRNTPNSSELIKQLELIANLIERETVDGAQALNILQFCRDNIINFQNRVDIIECIWETLQEKQFELTVNHYAAIIQANQRIDHRPAIFRIYEEMNKNGLKPTYPIYQMIISAYAKERNINQIIELIVQMKNNGFYLNKKVSVDVLRCAIINRNFDIAGRMLNELKKLDFDLTNEIIYHARHNDLKNVIETLNFFIREGILLNNGTICHAIRTLSTGKHSENIDKLFDYLKSSEVTDHFVRIEIRNFIEIGQASIIPKLLYAFYVNLADYTDHLIEEMERFKVPTTEMNQIIEDLKLLVSKSNSKKIPPKSRHEMLDPEFDEIHKTFELKRYGQESNDTHKTNDRFYAYLNEGNIAGIESILADGNLHMTGSKYARLINLFIEKNSLKKALNMFNAAIANEKSFKLNPIHLARLIALMIESDCEFDEINQLIYMHRAEEPLHRIIRYEKLFERLTALGNVELLNKLYDAIVKNNFIQETPFSMKYLIAIHLKSGNLNAAIDVYEHNIKTKDAAVQTIELMCQLIENNKFVELQRVCDLYEKARGESATQYRLAIAYLKCGMEQQVRTIFESGRIKNLGPKIESRLSIIENNGDDEGAKIIFNVTKGIPCDRYRIYRTLLEIYCNKSEYQNALDLWHEYKVENPSKPNDADFTNRLYHFFKDTDKEIPKELIVKEDEAEIV